MADESKGTDDKPKVKTSKILEADAKKTPPQPKITSKPNEHPPKGPKDQIDVNPGPDANH